MLDVTTASDEFRTVFFDQSLVTYMIAIHDEVPAVAISVTGNNDFNVAASADGKVNPVLKYKDIVDCLPRIVVVDTLGSPRESIGRQSTFKNVGVSVTGSC